MNCSGQQYLLINNEKEPHVRSQAILRFVYITTPAKKNRNQRMGQINFLTILKDWLSRFNQNKRKTVAPHITHLMCSYLQFPSNS